MDRFFFDREGIFVPNNDFVFVNIQSFRFHRNNVFPTMLMVLGSYERVFVELVRLERETPEIYPVCQSRSEINGNLLFWRINLFEEIVEERVLDWRILLSLGLEPFH